LLARIEVSVARTFLPLGRKVTALLNGKESFHDAAHSPTGSEIKTKGRSNLLEGENRQRKLPRASLLQTESL
jgi:hypothetical protein